MTARPFFSVIIPVYNRADVILPTLKSVASQTFSDFECIVVDDGSDDGGLLSGIVESLGDTRFRYVRRENGGACAARNTGVEVARGKYVAFLDSDDRFVPSKLARVRATCHPANNWIIFSQVTVLRGNGIQWVRPARGPKPGESIPDYLFCGGGWVSTSTIVMPRPLAQEVSWNTQLSSGQDTDFAVQLWKKGVQFIMINEPLAICDDARTARRISLTRNLHERESWLIENAPHMSARAQLAYRVSHLAYAGFYRRPLRSTLDIVVAIASGALPPSRGVQLAARAALPMSFYRGLVHAWYKYFGSY